MIGVIRGRQSGFKSQRSRPNLNPEFPDRFLKIRDRDLGLSSKNSGFRIDFEKFGIGIWDEVWKIRDLGWIVEKSGFGIQF